MVEPGKPRYPKADRVIARRLWLCAFLFYFIFAHGYFAGSDEYGQYNTARGLYETGDLALPKAKHVFTGRDGRRYSIFAPAQAVASLPLYAVGNFASRAMSDDWKRLFAGPRSLGPRGPELGFVYLYAPLASALLVALFFLAARQLGASRRNALVGACLFGATSYAGAMSVFYLRHPSEAALILGSFMAFHRFRSGAGARALAVGCLLASLLPLLRIPSAIAGPGLALYMLLVVLERQRGSAALTWNRIALAIVVPTAACAALHFGLTWYKWGSFFSTPVTGQEFSTPLWQGLYGFLLSPGSSVFLYTPLLLLLPWQLPGFMRAHRLESLSLGIVAVTYLVVCSMYEGWTGLWSAPGPRYIFAVVPLLMLPLPLWLDTRPAGPLLVATGVLAVAGFVVQLGIMLVDWGSVIVGMDYVRWAPGMGFVFVPELSPLIGTWKLVFQHAIGLWQWNAFHGFAELPAKPVAVTAILGCWAVLFAWSTWRLVRAATSSSA